MVKSTIVNNLIEYLKENPNVQQAFDEAFKKASDSGILSKYEITTLDDYFTLYDDMLQWTPSETVTGTVIYERLCLFYYVFDQPPLVDLQTHSTSEDRPWLAMWLADYAQNLGQFMDSPESITQSNIDTFYLTSQYHMEDYPVPPEGWKTFNEFFGRAIDPAKRPIADEDKENTIISPADCSYSGSWSINDAGEVDILCKGVPWNIAELLRDSDFKDVFKGGKFTHSFLECYDYHRQHAPVSGVVVEAKIIPGICYLGVTVEGEGDEKKLVARRRLVANRKADEENSESSGYQVIQARGFVLIDNPTLGLVGVILVGMAQTSSVILSVLPGATVNKGEEIGYFQMGGSDVIMIFQKQANVTLPEPSSPPARFKMGDKFATADPQQP